MSLVFLKKLFTGGSNPKPSKKGFQPLWIYNETDTFVDPAWAASFATRQHIEDPEKFEMPETSSEVSESTIVERDSKPSHFKIDARVISDAIIGLSDGLTVPFALTAGLSALGDTKVVVYGGLAELCAGAISMGLGGYLGAKSEEESYKATLAETRNLIATDPAEVHNSITDLFATYELPKTTIAELTSHLVSSPHLDRFLMRFHHTLPEPERSRAFTCALTIACGYFIGGFIPLLPYIFVPNDNVLLGLWWSIGIMIVALFVFGYTKTAFVAGWRGWRCILGATKGGIEMVVVGSVAAGAAMGLVIAFDHGASIGNAATAATSR